MIITTTPPSARFEAHQWEMYWCAQCGCQSSIFLVDVESGIGIDGIHPRECIVCAIREEKNIETSVEEFKKGYEPRRLGMAVKRLYQDQ